MDKGSAIVVGAGIVGLAIARALAIKGYKIKVFDRSERAVGASIRNFGMIWPIGQPQGELYDRAMRSAGIWKEIADEAGIWYDCAGSLHLAYHEDEAAVLEEFYHSSKSYRQIDLLNAAQILERSDAVVRNGLICGLYSSAEFIVDPRQAIAALPEWLAEKYKVEFYWNKCVGYVADNSIYIGNNEEHSADLIFICSGADFEILFPEEYAYLPITRCKLQMMRLAMQPGNWRIGPALCAGLSLIHYNSFKSAPSLTMLRNRYEQELAEYLTWGIHVMVSQTEKGELTVGDSHEYGLTHDPFDKEFINKMILGYVQQFARFKDNRVIETWNGVYLKLTNGETDIFLSPDPGVYIVNGLGGAGMTLSFGFAEEKIASIL